MNKVPFTKSLKFKMTVWYCAILLLFSLSFVLVMNIFLTKYMKESRPFKPIFMPNPIEREITEEERQLIAESRLKDLENIRILSIYSVIPLTLLSFLIGYLIANKMIRPLEQLSEEIRNRDINSLATPINFKDTGDEISVLTKHFNDMSQRVYNSYKAQKEFVQNASHEIKTPLSIIQANLEMALDEKNISKKELNDLLKECHNSVTFMNKLTEDLLLFSLLDTEISMKEIELCPLIHNARNLVSPLLKDNGFNIDIKCPKDIKIRGNETLLIRAFQNIIENSIKYSGGNKLDINVKKNHNNLFISFKDNGKGIQKDQCDRIFERFYRIDKSRSRKTGGSGLGLAITKEIIERHNGKIECISDIGKGCEFRISFIMI
jgi:signal transduction histidine kinase